MPNIDNTDQPTETGRPLIISIKKHLPVPNQSLQRVSGLIEPRLTPFRRIHIRQPDPSTGRSVESITIHHPSNIISRVHLEIPTHRHKAHKKNHLGYLEQFPDWLVYIPYADWGDVYPGR